MKKILVPVDFSDNAFVATRYAANLAKDLNWTIHLIHSYLSYSSNFATEEFNQEVYDNETEMATQNMKQFLEDVRADFSEVEFTSEVKEGVLANILKEITKSDEYDLIIMGTKGASGLKHVVLGTNTFDVIKKSTIPTLAVPVQPFSTILSRAGLLTNFKESEIEVLDAYIKVFGKPDSLVLFHILEKGGSKSEDDLKAWAEQIKVKTGVENVEYIVQEMVWRLDVREHFPDYIFNLTESQNLGILLVTKERRNFMNRLFSKSLVKALAHQLKTPIFFHAG